MKYVIILALIALLAYIANGECADYSVDTCIDEGLEAELACCVDGEACTAECETQEADSDCDDSDEDNYSIEYIGKSTKFSLVNNCNDGYITVTVADLTEMNAETGVKTNNKATSFANSKDWSFSSETQGLINDDCDGNGNSCLYNAFVTTLAKDLGKLTVVTRLALDELEVELVNATDNSTYYVNVTRGALKIDTIIEDWAYLDAANKLRLCVNFKTNIGGAFDADDEGRSYQLGSAQIDNLQTATCSGSAGNDTEIGVTVTDDGNDNNQITLCYTFDNCQNTKISYDPVIALTYDGAAIMSITMLMATVLASVFAM